MTKISAKIIADSKNTFGDRITTMVVTFPRFILAELNTHRMFSRNSASSRAIPFKKMVEAVQNNPFIPIAWQKDHKGMQGNEYLTDIMDIQRAEYRWLLAKTNAVEEAKVLSEGVGVTKQLCNRLLEPFMWHTVLITSTEWENFFALRCPQYHYNNKVFRSIKDYHKEWCVINNENTSFSTLTILEKLQLNKGQAEIHMMALAEAMWDAYNESTPKELKAGEWHIPFSDDLDFDTLALNYGKEVAYDMMIKISTARCARVSYTVVGEEGKEPNYENDIKLHDRLAESGHASPFEHCAKAMTEQEYYNSIMSFKLNGDYEITNKGILIDSLFVPDEGFGWSGNFKGFVQYRKMFNNENTK